MATSFNLPTLPKSHFFGHTNFTHKSSSSSSPTPKQSSHQIILTPFAKFNLYEILGGRGLCNGEQGFQQELKNPPPEFIQKNPPPKKSPPPPLTTAGFNQSLVRKLKALELPLLMPGMIAIVKNSNNPYYKYCGMVQRITDGKAAVLFEGGNCDRLITFRLSELERREKGPPMVTLRSVVLEELMEKSS